jgi:hypothetical protein
LLKQKIAQNVTITLGYIISSKNHNQSSKVAQLAKMAQSGHPISFNYRARSNAQIIFPDGFAGQEGLNKDPTVWLDGAIVGEIKYRMKKNWRIRLSWK